MDGLELLDPSNELAAASRAMAPRGPAVPDPIALLDINKTRSDDFLAVVAQELSARGVGVRRFRKESMAKPAARDLQNIILEECTAAIVALAD